MLAEINELCKGVRGAQLLKAGATAFVMEPASSEMGQPPGTRFQGDGHPSVHGCRSADDVCRVIHEEFVRWFDGASAGPPERYAQTAAEIWELWEVCRQAQK